MADTKRYRTFSDELKNIFGCRVHRISVDANFTCPNRDGTVGSGGCIYCGGAGSGSFGIVPGLSVQEQLEQGKEVMVRKYKAKKFMAYFQPYSNTYGPVPLLRELFDRALEVPDVVGLIVGTRPDCLGPDVLALLQEYHRRTYFWLELGLQSPHDKSLQFIRRGHDFATFADSAARCRRAGLNLCVHLILGLPGESREEMLKGAEIINASGAAGVKLHLLHVMRDTPLAEMYQRGVVRVLERDEYVGLVCDFLERLDPAIIVQRVTGDGARDHLVAPLWSLAKFEVLNCIDRELERRGNRQGSRFQNG